MTAFGARGKGWAVEKSFAVLHVRQISVSPGGEIVPIALSAIEEL
jgi:hypothetical protein